MPRNINSFGKDKRNQEPRISRRRKATKVK